MYAPEHLGVSAQFYVIFEHGHRPVFDPVSDRHTLPESAVCADDGVGVNENIAEMINPQARSDSGGFRYADAGQGLGEPKRNPIKTVCKPTNYARFSAVVAAAETVDPQGPGRLLAEQCPRGVSTHVGLPVRIGHRTSHNPAARATGPPFPLYSIILAMRPALRSRRYDNCPATSAHLLSIVRIP